MSRRRAPPNLNRACLRSEPRPGGEERSCEAPAYRRMGWRLGAVMRRPEFRESVLKINWIATVIRFQLNCSETVAGKSKQFLVNNEFPNGPLSTGCQIDYIDACRKIWQ